MSSVHTDLLREQGYGFTDAPLPRSTGPEPPSRGNRARHRRCSDASRAAARDGTQGCSPEPVQVACGAADDFTRSSRGRSVSSRHVRWGLPRLPKEATVSAVLLHTRSPGGACQARRRRTSSITAAHPRTLALGTYRDRRSRVSPARSLFSSQTTDRCLSPPVTGASGRRAHRSRDHPPSGAHQKVGIWCAPESRGFAD